MDWKFFSVEANITNINKSGERSPLIFMAKKSRDNHLEWIVLVGMSIQHYLLHEQNQMSYLVFE